MNIRKAVILTALTLSACSLDSGKDLVVATPQATLSSNRVVLNRVVLNSLAATALANTRIAQGPIVDGLSMAFNTSYDPNAEDGAMLHQTVEGRDVLGYVVRCALGADKTVTVTHDGQQYDFHGALGLAESWITRALSAHEQALLSACLYAHVNHFGVAVELSIRFPGTSVGAEAAEGADYPVLEGAFMGEYFVGETGVLEMYACQGDGYDVAIVNSDSRDLRVCTDVDSGCGLTVIGRCREVCEGYQPGYGWYDCWADGVKYAEVANVFLDASDPDGRNETCPVGGTCRGGDQLHSGEDNIALFTANGAADADVHCGDDSVCIINGVAADGLTVKVHQNAIAEVNCAGAGSCAVTAAEDASVEINCRGADACTDIVCRAGASCLLQCGASTPCGFALCNGALVTCANGALACDAECL